MRSDRDQRILEGRIVEDQYKVADPAPGASRRSRGGHGWMMIACCIPMLVIAGILVATGVASPGFLAAAVGCTLIMALMMRGMGHNGGDDTP
jgi:hypothetical protein